MNIEMWVFLFILVAVVIRSICLEMKVLQMERVLYYLQSQIKKLHQLTLNPDEPLNALEDAVHDPRHEKYLKERVKKKAN